MHSKTNLWLLGVILVIDDREGKFELDLIMVPLGSSHLSFGIRRGYVPKAALSDIGLWQP